MFVEDVEREQRVPQVVFPPKQSGTSDDGQWTTVAKDYANTRYSALNEINTGNAGRDVLEGRNRRARSGAPHRRHHDVPRDAALAIFFGVIGGGCHTNYDREAAHLTGGDPRRGVEAIGKYGCGSCHDIPGIRNARGTVGPPLARVASRTYLAGRVTNTPADMIRWIQHPQQIERGTAMPEMGVTENDARDIAAYLYTLH